MFAYMCVCACECVIACVHVCGLAFLQNCMVMLSWFVKTRIYVLCMKLIIFTASRKMLMKLSSTVY